MTLISEPPGQLGRAAEAAPAVETVSATAANAVATILFTMMNDLRLIAMRRSHLKGDTDPQPPCCNSAFAPWTGRNATTPLPSIMKQASWSDPRYSRSVETASRNAHFLTSRAGGVRFRRLRRTGDGLLERSRRVRAACSHSRKFWPSSVRFHGGTRCNAPHCSRPVQGRVTPPPDLPCTRRLTDERSISVHKSGVLSSPRGTAAARGLRRTYRTCTPEMARLTMRRWISDVPSKRV
jgi:hypothetical protein